MAEHQSKSKLKRKKSSFSEDHHPETSFRGTLSRSHTMFSSYTAAEPGRSTVPAAAWWSREQLPAVESLWALTLKSARLQQLCDLVPDLPHPSTAGPKALEVDERWCDLSEELAPFPEPSPLSPRTSLSPDLLRLSPPLQDLLVQTKPAPDPADKQLSFHSKQSQNGKATSLQTLNKRPQPYLHSWEGVASSAGPPSVGGEQGKETGTFNQQLLPNQVRVSDKQKKAENEEEGVEDTEEEEAQRSVRGDGATAAAGGGGGGGGGGGRLQSCPMCLLVFPARFTQMDCDGHLAQCLSEVNVDMTW